MNSLNVYEMWLANGGKPGCLWIARDSWGNTIAEVLECEPLIGNPPYFNSAPDWKSPRVWARFYKRNGRPMAIDQVSCPNTYAYREIPRPAWAS